MLTNRQITVVVVSALAVITTPVVTGAAIDSRASEVIAVGADPLLTVERHRSAIIERLVNEHRAMLFASGIPEASFRNALESLRGDQLLSAALADSLAGITAIVSQSQDRAAPAVRLKDGSGSGANSWIGYTAGSNAASGAGSAVAAGTFNAATTTASAVFGGQSNVASGISSLVIGGFDNRATAIDSLVGAGAGNRATGARSVVVGGGYNLASGQWSFVGGGGRDGTASTPAGTNALDHIASGAFSAIAGGQGNRTIGLGSFIGGGTDNTAGSATEQLSAVVGGGSNTATGTGSTIVGGFGNVVGGAYSTVAGGVRNNASALFSFVAGHDGTADKDNCAIFAFWSTFTPLNCQGRATIVRVGADHGFSAEYFSQRPDGGGTKWVYIGDLFLNQTITATSGAFLSDAGVWSSVSDRNQKDDFKGINTRDVLQRLVAMPIQRWHYKVEVAGVTHIGPVAQDFHAAFGLGSSDTTIGTVDADGVALAAIQGLNEVLHEELQRRDATIALQQAAIDDQRSQLQGARAQLSAQQDRIAFLEKQYGQVAAAQLQIQDIARATLALQQEMAHLQHGHEVAAVGR